MAGKTVCVTGASGFIASWLVKKLLEKGYTVKATVRDPQNVVKTSHLLKLPHASERLQLVKAELLEEGSFQEAIAGCFAVFHTASPFIVGNITDPQVQLLDPAVKGTLNVLREVKRNGGIARVILTSSVAAVWYFPDLDPNVPLDESCWSDEQYCRNKNLWYPLSKTLAEREAWKFAKENGIDLVTINPAMVVGKLLQPTMNTSSEMILKFINGVNKVYPNFAIGWVHVEDVADMHILALENLEAEGRYLCIASWLHWKEITIWLRHIEPSAPITTDCADEQPKFVTPLFSNKKSRALGVKYKNIETMLRDCVESLKQNNFVELELLRKV